MQNKPKLIAFDVDGTLLTSSHAVSTMTRQALGQLAHDGHYVLLATARPPKSVAEIAAQLGIDHTISIALNGAMIIRDNKILWDVPMERFAVKEIIQESRQWGLHANLMAGWDWLVEESGYWCEQEAAIVGFEPETVADLTADSMPDAHKVLFMGNAEDIALLTESGLSVEACHLVLVYLSQPTVKSSVQMYPRPMPWIRWPRCSIYLFQM
jgi:HAD superfamily hydrolase (TIGR01484 family)